jgi:NTE family protein
MTIYKNNSSKIETLKRLELFEKLPEHILLEIETHLISKTMEEGELVFSEGDNGSNLYLIFEGQVKITIENKQGDEIQLAILKNGDYFGEMALLTDTCRTATATTIKKTCFQLLSKEDFSELLKKHIEVSILLSEVLSSRLASTNRLIQNKAEHKIIYTLAGDTQQTGLNHFIQYLKSITTKEVIILENILPKQLAQAINRISNTFIIIKSSTINGQLIGQADEVVNFMSDLPGQHYIKESNNFKLIESVVRTVAKKRIGIALSSGTAPGLAHIGVLKVLHDNQIPIDYIAGTSGGALYGAPFAFGCSYEDIYATFSSIYKKSLIRLWDYAGSKQGIFKGQKLLNQTIKKLIGQKNIEEALIPFCAVSSDLYTGEEFQNKTGNLITAIRASLSIPIMFKPVPHDNKLLVDGVVTTPVPISVLEDQNIDIKIAVYVSELTEFSTKKPNLMSVFLRSRNITADYIADESMEHADVILKPQIADLKEFEYNRIDEIIKTGETAARKSLRRIIRLYKA